MTRRILSRMSSSRLIEEVAAALHRDELAGVELRVELLDVLEDLGADFAGDVLQEQLQEVAAVAPGAPILARAQEEAGAGRRLVEFSDAWEDAPSRDLKSRKSTPRSATGRHRR